MSSHLDFDLASIASTIQTFFSNFTNNVSSTFSNLSVRDYIRIVWIIGGYLFLRPYIDLGFRKLLQRHDRKAEEGAAAGGGSADADANAPANVLRGLAGDDHGSEEEEEGEEGEEGEGTSKSVPQWGKTARRRQRKYLEHVVQEAERLKEEEDDQDIADLLEDD